MTIELFFVCRKYKQVREIILYANSVFSIIDRYKIQNKDKNVLISSNLAEALKDEVCKINTSSYMMQL